MRRTRPSPGRCPGCRLHQPLCICAELPALSTRTRVVLLLHQAELNKTTNTGRLALRCLTNRAMVVRGRDMTNPAAPIDGGALDPAPRLEPTPGWMARLSRPVLLFPHPEATPVERWRPGNGADGTGGEGGDAPLTLLVPDGTWSQAVRARKRIEGAADIPCVSLPENLTSGYKLRRDPRPAHVSTLEAIAHALGILEDPAITTALLRVQRLLTERTLWTRGVLTDDQVTDGLPPGVRRHTVV